MWWERSILRSVLVVGGVLSLNVALLAVVLLERDLAADRAVPSRVAASALLVELLR